MNQMKKFAFLGALAVALSAPVFAQTAANDDTMAASGTMQKSTGGTTLHKKDKAAHLKGASAAAAASALGTNDKGQPH